MSSYFYDFDLYLSPEQDIPNAQLEGSNEKNLLIIIKTADYSDENKAFLAKILSAIKYDLEKDSTILKVPEEETYSISALLKNNSYSNVLVFGIKMKDLGFSAETFLYSPFMISEITYLVNHPLEKVKASVEYKKSLWTALQAMPFNN